MCLILNAAISAALVKLLNTKNKIKLIQKKNKNKKKYKKELNSI